MKKALIYSEFRKYLSDNNKDISKKKLQLTPDFNLLYLISPNEVQISKIIAELLNPNGFHEHKTKFLDVFIKMFLGKIQAREKTKKITVSTEYAKEVNGQIDIMVDFDQKYGIGIENKPFAIDQDQQIERYVDFLEKKYGSTNYTMIYISNKGNFPTSTSLSWNRRNELGTKFIVISYQDLRKWLLKCYSITIKSEADRLAILISEVAEYINLIFLNTNSLKNEIMSKTIKNNILDAYELTRLWKENETDFINYWSNEINNLFNTVLPKLVFNKLQSRNIINSNWTIIEGDFNVLKNSVKGFSLKKKKWVNFEYTVLSSKVKTEAGSRDIFLAIKSKTNVEFNIPNYIEKYSDATSSDIYYNLWKSPRLIWWSIFPDKRFRIWGYKQWVEISTDGHIVSYLTDFLEKLIIASEHDIDAIEEQISNFKNK